MLLGDAIQHSRDRNDFSKALAVNAQDASRYFGQDSKGIDSRCACPTHGLFLGGDRKVLEYEAGNKEMRWAATAIGERWQQTDLAADYADCARWVHHKDRKSSPRGINCGPVTPFPTRIGIAGGQAGAGGRNASGRNGRFCWRRPAASSVSATPSSW